MLEDATSVVVVVFYDVVFPDETLRSRLSL